MPKLTEKQIEDLRNQTTKKVNRTKITTKNGNSKIQRQ